MRNSCEAPPLVKFYLKQIESLKVSVVSSVIVRPCKPTKCVHISVFRVIEFHLRLFAINLFCFKDFYQLFYIRHFSQYLRNCFHSCDSFVSSTALHIRIPLAILNAIYSFE